MTTPEKYAPNAWEKGPSDRWGMAALALFAVVCLGVASALILARAPVAEGRLMGLDWFDPFFFAYNVLLSLFAVLIVPAIVYFYVRLMKAEKHRRLRREMDPEEWARVEDEVRPLIQRQFRFRQYVGSLLALTFVLAAGVSIMLLMKPFLPPEVTPEATLADGVNFSRGANILMLGPFIESYPGDLASFNHQVVVGLTAFQFGFLGAYVYFIGALLRAYFTLDLSTHTLVAGTIRMVTSSVLALVLSFFLPQLPFLEGATDEAFLRALPVFAFFIGLFPKRGLLWLDLWGSRALGLGRQRYRQTHLGELSGMSTDHETRLVREGYDNVENLAHAQALDLAVRTGFGYQQLRSWIGEARLRLALRDDFEAFSQKTWLRTDEQVRAFYRAWHGSVTEATEHLAKACGGMEEKIRNLALLLGCETAPEPAEA